MTKKLIALLERVETEYDKSNLLADIPAIVEEINAIFGCIKATNTFDEAQPYFDFLMNEVCIPIERMRYLYEVDVGDELSKFIYDFDRIDDLKTRERLYKQIKAGTYRLDADNEETFYHA